jgi:hypothetical protein
LHWNGSGWSVVTTPNPLHWDGTAWSHVAGPNPGPSGSNADMLGVSARTSTDAWAVGVYFGATPGTVALHWDGTAWTVS